MIRETMKVILLIICILDLISWFIKFKKIKNSDKEWQFRITVNVIADILIFWIFVLE